MKLTVFSAAVAALALGGVAGAQQLTAAQQNYRRCPVEAMARGVDIVRSVCGELAAAPQLPTYDQAWGVITRSTFLSYTSDRERYSSTVAGYTQCIDTRVMQAPNMPIETLDYAACAHQAAEERRTQAIRDWGRTCQAYEDSTGQRADEPCFPQS